jgi:hypothetical protein
MELRKTGGLMKLSIHLSYETWTRMFIATLFVIVSKWKQPKFQNGLRNWGLFMCFRLEQYYIAMAKNEVLIYTKTWIYLRSIKQKKAGTKNA